MASTRDARKSLTLYTTRNNKRTCVTQLYYATRLQISPLVQKPQFRTRKVRTKNTLRSCLQTQRKLERQNLPSIAESTPSRVKKSKVDMQSAEYLAVVEASNHGIVKLV